MKTFTISRSFHPANVKQTAPYSQSVSSMTRHEGMNSRGEEDGRTCLINDFIEENPLKKTTVFKPPVSIRFYFAAGSFRFPVRGTPVSNPIT
jgi:hypothetical protein